METTEKYQYRRRAKHRYRRLIRISLIAAAVIAGVFVVVYLRQSPEPQGTAGTDDDSSVQFK